MSIERKNGVTLGGKPLTVIGPALKAGDKAPDFKLLANDSSAVTLKDSNGKYRLISVVTSLDTGICDAQTRRFNEEAAKLGNDVVVLTVSADLPTAQKRWCGAAGIDRVITLSDHFDMNFGSAYGTYIKEIRLEQRAIFIVDNQNLIRYVEYVPEVAQHPDYEKALDALKKILS